MSKEIQSKLRELKEMLIEDGYNNSNIVMQTLTEIIEKHKGNTQSVISDFKKTFFELPHPK